jgi:hypothetical protein
MSPTDLTKSRLGAILVLLGAVIATIAVPVPGANAQPAAAGAALLPMPPADLARVWFVRQYQPGENLSTPMIFVDGAPLASSLPGTIFYRDVAPGTHTFTVETCGTDVNQSQTLQLLPGGQAELEIQSLQSFTPPDCPLGAGTFYVRQLAPRFLQLYLPQLAYLGAR